MYLPISEILNLIEEHIDNSVKISAGYSSKEFYQFIQPKAVVDGMVNGGGKTA